MLITNTTGGQSYLIVNLNLDNWTDDIPSEGLTTTYYQLPITSLNARELVDIFTPEYIQLKQSQFKSIVSRKYTQIDLSGLLNINVLQAFANTFNNRKRGDQANSTTFYVQMGEESELASNNDKYTGMVFDSFSINVPNTGYLTYSFSAIGNIVPIPSQSKDRLSIREQFFSLVNLDVQGSTSQGSSIFFNKIESIDLSINITNNRTLVNGSFFDLRPVRGVVAGTLNISCIASALDINNYNMYMDTNNQLELTITLDNGIDSIQIGFSGTITALETPIQSDGYVLLNITLQAGLNGTNDLISIM